MDRFDDCVIMIHRDEKQSNLEMMDTKLYTLMITKRRQISLLGFRDGSALLLPRRDQAGFESQVEEISISQLSESRIPPNRQVGN